MKVEVTTDQAAEALGVPANTISQWKARGLVVPTGYIPGRGRNAEAPLFDYDDLYPLAAAWHARKARHAAGDVR